MARWVKITLLWCFTSVSLWGAVSNQGIIKKKNANNRALIVGVPDQLEGIDIDLVNVEKLVSHPRLKFESETLWDSEATARKIQAALTENASEVGEDGTLFFYFSGHGDVGLVEAYDESLTVRRMKNALIKGREGLGPIHRLVMIFDSCHSGSLADPMNVRFEQSFADRLVAEFSPNTSPFWKSLLVISSSLAEEESSPSEEGSIFTLAMMKAFDEVAETPGTIGEWVEKTKLYTTEHHPIERAVPRSILSEKIF